MDVVADLDRCREGPLSSRNGSVDEMLLSHFIEHVRDPLPLMQELHRVARPGCRMTIRVPHGASDNAYEDPTHVRPYFLNSFRLHQGTRCKAGVLTVPGCGCSAIRGGLLASDARLQATSLETRVRQLSTLMASRELFRPDPDRELLVADVRERWAHIHRALDGCAASSRFTAAAG